MDLNEVKSYVETILKNLAYEYADRDVPVKNKMDEETDKKDKVLDQLHYLFERMGVDMNEVSALSYEDQILKMIRLAQKMVYHLEEQRDADGYLWLSFQKDQDRS